MEKVSLLSCASFRAAIPTDDQSGETVSPDQQKLDSVIITEYQTPRDLLNLFQMNFRAGPVNHLTPRCLTLYNESAKNLQTSKGN